MGVIQTKAVRMMGNQKARVAGEFSTKRTGIKSLVAGLRTVITAPTPIDQMSHGLPCMETFQAQGNLEAIIQILEMQL